MTLEEHLRLAYLNGQQPMMMIPEATEEDPEPEAIEVASDNHPVDVPTVVTEDLGNAVVVDINGVRYQVSGDQLTIV